MLPRADILVRDGRIEAVGPDLAAAGAETIDATDMIVMPGFVDTHYHMWSAVGRNFVGDGFGYFAAKNATSKLFEPADFYNSVMLGLVELRQCRRHHRAQLVAQHAHPGARRRRIARAPRNRCCARSIRHGHVDQMPRDEPLDFTAIDRLQARLFRQAARPFEGLVTYGVNLRGALAERGSRLPPGDGTARLARTEGRDPRRPVAAQPR